MVGEASEEEGAAERAAWAVCKLWPGGQRTLRPMLWTIRQFSKASVGSLSAKGGEGEEAGLRGGGALEEAAARSLSESLMTKNSQLEVAAAWKEGSISTSLSSLIAKTWQ